MGICKIWNKKIFYPLFKRKTQETRAETVTLDNELKGLQQNPNCSFDRNYLDYKNKLEQIHEEKANDVKIRSKCECTSLEKNLQNFSLTQENNMLC